MFELIAAVILLLLLALSGALIYRLRALTEEARLLKSELSDLRHARRGAAAEPKAGSDAPPASEAPLAEAPEARSAAPSPSGTAPHGAPLFPRRPGFAEAAPENPAAPMLTLGAARRGGAALASGSAQGQLPLAPDPSGALPPLPLDVLIRALQFPETAEDAEGFRALRRALRDHRAGQLIQAAQDILTLLSQEGLYMDDLPPDRARPELWRRFAQGARGGSVAALGGIRDRSALAMAGSRMRDDPVFRDATHHFLRRFDHMLADLEPDASDAQIAALSDTRTARAFMLLGRVMGIFD